MRIGAVVSHLRVLTTTALNRPSNLRRAPTETRRPRLATSPTPHPHQLPGTVPCRGGNAAHAPEPPTPSTAASRGDRSPTGKLGTRGSPSCNRNPHTTLRIAARWPPLPAPEASGYALLVYDYQQACEDEAERFGRWAPPTRARGRASRAGLPRRGHPTAPVVPQAYWRSGSSGRARSAKSRPG